MALTVFARLAPPSGGVFALRGTTLKRVLLGLQTPPRRSQILPGMAR
jgi:hypothetical protein